MSGGQDEVDMMAAVAGEEYFMHRIKVHCLETNRNAFGPEFIECFKRSNQLFANYFQRISDISLEMNLQEDDTTDPSLFLTPPNNK